MLMVDKDETVQLAVVPQETDFSDEIHMQFQFKKIALMQLWDFCLAEKGLIGF